jgi:phage terminase large subunit
VIAGLDFGFSKKHPLGLVVAGLIGDSVYVFDEVYGSKISLEDLIIGLEHKVKELDIEIIYADSARPDLISELQDAGLPVVAASKGPDSVMSGIQYVDSLINQSLLIISKACGFTLREMDSYIWDKRNLGTERPLKRFDHLLDAIRYMLFSDHKQHFSFGALPI